eukprot:scaffold134613_cov30-Tisochrysis_lutea.AAC.1
MERRLMPSPSGSNSPRGDCRQSSVILMLCNLVYEQGGTVHCDRSLRQASYPVRRLGGGVIDARSMFISIYILMHQHLVLSVRP